jgi:hypothetical protein
LLLTVSLLGCGATPSPPVFDGWPTETWLAFDVDLPDRDARDVLGSFVESAHASGCPTLRTGRRMVGLAGRGYARVWSGATAYCDEGNIALIAVTTTRVRIGCEQPTTHDQCDALLRKISAAR